MKCYNHPVKDAVGVCSVCGKGVCAECARTIDRKILCEECSTPRKPFEPLKLKQYTLIIAALGWLGSACIILIGMIYYEIFLRISNIPIFAGLLQMEAYSVGISTTVVVLMLAFGGYLMWRGHVRKGGILNLAAGIATILIYGYFIWRFPGLSAEAFGFWFADLPVVGPLLCALALSAPAVISGILGLILVRFFKEGKIRV